MGLSHGRKSRSAMFLFLPLSSSSCVCRADLRAYPLAAFAFTVSHGSSAAFFYYFIMFSWFRLSRVLEDDAIVIPCSGSSVCPLSTLFARFVYHEFSKIAVSRSGQTATSLSPSKILRTIILVIRDNYPQSSFFYPLKFTPLYLRQTPIPHQGIILQG